MDIAMLSPSLSRAAGGIYEIERSLSLALHNLTGVDVDVFGLRDEYTVDDLPEWAPLSPSVFKVRGPGAFGYAPGLREALFRTSADILHLHALWMYTSVVSVQWTRKLGRPHVVTVNGMLDDWALNNSGWKKQLAGWAYERPNLEEAGCIQVNTEKELRAVRAFGIDTPVCVIPNGVDLPSDDATNHSPPWMGVIEPDTKVLLFLGRLHPKKGLNELIDGWEDWSRQSSASDEWALGIIGWDDGGHEDALRRRAEKSTAGDSIHFLGPQFGGDKHAAFANADAFILPSYSEGFPMAVLEAWSHRLPVLKTDACNIPEGFKSGAAIEVTTHPESIAAGIDEVTRRDADERAAIGERGRKLVEDRFTWAQVARQMYDVYRWVLGDSDRPDSVVMN
jgi:poly(glycerol-phosphate) alpha-glucosyltransferase